MKTGLQYKAAAGAGGEAGEEALPGEEAGGAEAGGGAVFSKWLKLGGLENLGFQLQVCSSVAVVELEGSRSNSTGSSPHNRYRPTQETGVTGTS